MFLFIAVLLLPIVVIAGSNHKRGLAFSPAGHPEDLALAANSRPSWVYNWAVQRPTLLPSGVVHIPMQWGSGGIENFAAQVRTQGAKTILVSMALDSTLLCV